MKSIDIYLDDFKRKDEPISMCLGYFDGVHLGHQHLLDIASKRAKYKLGVLIFDKPIATFIDNAKEGDIILLLGKGHETYREIKGVREHLDEREVIKDILNNK